MVAGARPPRKSTGDNRGLSLNRQDKHVDNPGQVLYGQRKSLISLNILSIAHFLGRNKPGYPALHWTIVGITQDKSGMAGASA